MADSRVEQMARVLVDYSLQIRPRDIFRIRAEVAAEPLIREVYRLATRRGAYPFVVVTLPGLPEIWLRDAPDDALDWVSPIDQAQAEQITADLIILADTNTHHLAGVDPKRLARLQKARTPISRRWVERGGGTHPEMRWCATLFPVNALAQDAGMSLSDYEAFVYQGMRLDAPDPVQAWQDFAAAQERHLRRIQGTDRVRVVAEDTDITFCTAGRLWCSADGRRNLPDGEIFTGPQEDSIHGHIRFSYPTVYQGQEAEDVRLWWENGLLVRWEARRGQELLDQLLGMDAGARRLGEFALGTNHQITAFSKNILFDEKIGGTCHFAVGSSIPETGGVNQSALHWDMVCDLRRGGLVYADGELIQENGQWIGAMLSS